MSLFVYSTATLVGLVSFIPGGLGTFDLTCIALFSAMDYETTRLFLSDRRLPRELLHHSVAHRHALRRRRAARPQVRVERQAQARRLLHLDPVDRHARLRRDPDPLGDHAGHLRADRDTAGVHPRGRRLASSITSLASIRDRCSSSSPAAVRARVARIYGIALGLLVVGAAASLLKGFDFEEAILLLFVAWLLFLARDSFSRQRSG